jgi:hypothetical protein
LSFKGQEIEMKNIQESEKEILKTIVMDKQVGLNSSYEKKSPSTLTNRLQIKEALDLINGGDASIIKPPAGSLPSLKDESIDAGQDLDVNS